MSLCLSAVISLDEAGEQENLEPELDANVSISPDLHPLNGPSDASRMRELSQQSDSVCRYDDCFLFMKEFMLMTRCLCRFSVIQVTIKRKSSKSDEIFFFLCPVWIQETVKISCYLGRESLTKRWSKIVWGVRKRKNGMEMWRK